MYYHIKAYQNHYFNPYISIREKIMIIISYLYLSFIFNMCLFYNLFSKIFFIIIEIGSNTIIATISITVTL